MSNYRDHGRQGNVSVSGEIFGTLPQGRQKRAIDGWILAFLLVQIAVPTSYYVGNDLPTSERFSWRMFSSIDLSRWECTVLETRTEGEGEGGPPPSADRPFAKQPETVPPTPSTGMVVVNLDGAVQSSTARSIRRGELDVVNKFLIERVKQPGVQAVYYETRGTAPSGQSLGTFRVSTDRSQIVLDRKSR